MKRSISRILAVIESSLNSPDQVSQGLEIKDEARLFSLSSHRSSI